MVRLGVVMLDGTKIRAQASMNATRTRTQLEAEVAAMFVEANSTDGAEDEEQGEGSDDRSRRCCEVVAPLDVPD